MNKSEGWREGYREVIEEKYTIENAHSSIPRARYLQASPTFLLLPRRSSATSLLKVSHTEQRRTKEATSALCKSLALSGFSPLLTVKLPSLDDWYCDKGKACNEERTRGTSHLDLGCEAAERTCRKSYVDWVQVQRKMHTTSHTIRPVLLHSSCKTTWRYLFSCFFLIVSIIDIIIWPSSDEIGQNTLIVIRLFERSIGSSDGVQVWWWW